MDEEIFSLMKWCNPEKWTDDKDYRIDEIREFASHFHIPLSRIAYDKTKIRLKWRNFHCHVSLNLPGKEAHVLWKNILSYKQKEFPNICLLAELMYCLSASNSAIKRGFSILTMMLSDRRLKTLHDLTNFRIALKINNRNWNDLRDLQKRSEILWWALEICLSKSRRKEKLMNLVLIIQWKCNHLRVKTANLIHLIMILTICLVKKILTMNSLMKMNLCKIIFHVKFSIKNIFINKQKLILMFFFLFLFLSRFLWSRNNVSCF